MNAEEKPKKLKSKDKDVEDCQTYAQKLKKKMDHKVYWAVTTAVTIWSQHWRSTDEVNLFSWIENFYLKSLG